MKTDAATQTDIDALTALNRDYIHSVQHGDVRRFDEILAEDFLCSNPDGSLVDKSQFLAQTVRPVTITGLEAQDVKVRILGHVAIIHARTSYTTADGEQRNGRYTDVWARRDGKWLAVSAHVTRSRCSRIKVGKSNPSPADALATSSPADAGAAGRDVVVHLPRILAEIFGRPSLSQCDLSLWSANQIRVQGRPSRIR